MLTRRALPPLLERIEQKFGRFQPREVIISIWGMETGFGAIGGNRDVSIRSLATLAHARFRGNFFRNELIYALQILEKGDVPRQRLMGSWAGAMGQPQFLPSSFVQYAVDFSGDDRRDIWTSVPDALGSIASYMKGYGWTFPPTLGFRGCSCCGVTSSSSAAAHSGSGPSAGFGAPTDASSAATTRPICCFRAGRAVPRFS